MTVKKLDSLCDFISGLWIGKKSPYIKVGVIRNTNFHKSGNLDFSDIAELNVEVKQFSTRQLKFGDIILEKSGGGPKQPVGRVCIFEKQEELFSLSNFTSAIRIKNPKELDYKYLHYYLKHLYITGETEKIQTNSTGIRNLQLSLYKEFLVPLPSLKIQQTIVTKLDRIFAEIDKATVVAEANTKNAEALFQNYLTEILEPGGDDWEIKSIEEITLETKNVSFNKSPKLEFKYVDVSSISNSSYSIISTQTLIGKDAPSRAKKNIITNDILFATVRPTLKRIAIVPEYLNNQVASTGYVVLRTNIKNYYKFLFYFLLTRKFNDAMKALQRGASYPAVSDADVKSQKLFVPKLEDQYKITDKLDKLISNINIKIILELKKIKELKALKKSILKQAFIGELVKAA